MLSLIASRVPPPDNFPNFSTPERLVAAMGQLPPIAQVLARLQRLLSDTNSGLSDIVELIRLDAAMTTRVIQISNSTWFNRGGGCRTIDEAVNRVGFREIYHLVSVTAAASIVSQPLTIYARDSQSMWRESMACAFAAELLAERLGEDTAVAYMTGLLHGIGRLAINKGLLASGRTVTPLFDAGFPDDFSGAEFALFGFTQADVGALMLEKWSFARENIEPIRRQYNPLDAEEPHDRMSAILYAARFLRTTICQGEPAAENEHVEEVFQHLRLSRHEVLECLPVLEQLVARAVQITKA